MKRISNILYWRKPKESKVIKLIEIIFIMVIASLTIPTITWAGSINHVSGDTADASFSNNCDCSVTPTCILDAVSVSVSLTKVQNPPGNGVVSPFINGFLIVQFDCSTGTTLVEAFCFPLATPDFQVGTKLDTASLNTTLECFNDFPPFSSFNVSANLTWTATGPVNIRDHSSNHFQTPGCTVNSHFNGTSRPAQASGTVSDGTTNFTPDPTENADLASMKSGTVTIDCQ